MIELIQSVAIIAIAGGVIYNARSVRLLIKAINDTHNRVTALEFPTERHREDLIS